MRKNKDMSIYGNLPANEAKAASTLVAQGKKAGKYKSKPGDRNAARLQTKFEGSSVDWFSQDTNMLFKTGRYLFSVPVQGTTDLYTVTIEIADFLPLLEKALQTNPFNVPTFQKTLTQALRNSKIKVACTCSDFIYRWQYTATINDTNAGRPENRPAVVTNPTSQEGYCKHILMVLQNRAFAAKIARNLFNYVFDLWKKNRPLFDRIIRPGLNITDEFIENRPIKPRYAPKVSQTQTPENDSPEASSDSATEHLNGTMLNYVKPVALTSEQLDEAKSLALVSMSQTIDDDVLISLEDCDYIELVYNKEKLVGCLFGNIAPLLDSSFVESHIKKVAGDSKAGFLELLAIDSEFRGFGIGRKLTENFTHFIGDLVVYLGTHKSLNYGFYDALGFHRIADWPDGPLGYVFSSNTSKMKALKKCFFSFSPSAATEDVNSYYQGRTTYDDDQNFMLEVARDSGVDISLFVTPENTPEQMSELVTALQEGATNSLLHALSDPSLPPVSISILARAARQKVNLLPYRDFAPDVLVQLLRGAKYKIPLDKLALRGFNGRQIEQLISAYLKSKALYKELVDTRLNYQQMRDRIKDYK